MSPLPNPTAAKLEVVSSGYGAVFVVGVTGHIDLCPGDEAEIRGRVREFLLGLKSGRKRKGLGARLMEYLLEPEGVRWGHGEEVAEAGPLDARAGLRLGLVVTPVVVMSSLAPGADTLVAEVALELGMRVVAPLPFDAAIYAECSSFQEKPKLREGMTEEEAATERARAAAGTEEHRATLRRLLGDEGVQSFTVRLDGEVCYSEEQLCDVQRADLGDQKRRHRRYTAAGMYVAAYCDVLLALWNGDETGAAEHLGTAGTVRMKRRGFPPDILPPTADLRWVDCGMVVHVPVQRVRDAAAPQEKVMRILLPVDAKRPVVKTDWVRQGSGGEPHDEAAAWNTAPAPLSTMHRMAENLERLNTDWRAEEERLRNDPKSGYKDGWGGAERRETTEMLGPDAPLADALEGMARARRRFSTMSRARQGAERRQLKCLFLLVPGAAAVEHVYSHCLAEWWGLLVLGLGMVLGGWWWYVRTKKSKRVEMGQDYRALSEALRVQIYWAAAGMGNSVAANYLVRQRSELDYQRSVVMAWAMPYETAPRAFAGLPEAQQKNMLCRVHDGWVRGQLRYFVPSVTEMKHRGHRLHRWSFDLASAGLVLAVLILVIHVFMQGAFYHSHEQHLLLLLMSLLLLAGASLLAYKEKILLSEVTYQFSTMIALYHSLNLRMREWMGEDCYPVGDALALRKNKKQWRGEENLRKQEEKRRRAWSEEPSATRKEALPVADLVERMHDVLFIAGKEAMDEHAEWLILHRARPLELPMAG